MKDYHHYLDEMDDYYPGPQDFGYYHESEVPDLNGVKDALRAMFKSLYVNPDEDKAKENLDYLLQEFMIEI